MSRDSLASKRRNAKLNARAETSPSLSDWLLPLLASYLEPSLAARDLIGYSCHSAGAHGIILGDERFHPIEFPFVLHGCSDANQFNRAHFHFPLSDYWQIHEQPGQKSRFVAEKCR